MEERRRAQSEERLAAGPAWTPETDLLFPDPLRHPVDPAKDWRAWKQVLRAAGVRDVRLHDARHTAATLLLVQGVDIRTVMAIMGWTEMATAQRYSHAVDGLRQEAARRMGSALWTPDDASLGRASRLVESLVPPAFTGVARAAAERVRVALSQLRR